MRLGWHPRRNEQRWIQGFIRGLRTFLIRSRFARGPTTTPQPSINLVLERAHGTSFGVNVSLNGQAFTLLPALDGAYVSTQIYRDFLPGVQTVPVWTKHRPSARLHWVDPCSPHFRSKPFLAQPADFRTSASAPLALFQPSSPSCASFKTCGGGSVELSASKN